MADKRPMFQRAGRALDFPVGAIHDGNLLEGDRCLPQSHRVAAKTLCRKRCWAPPAAIRPAGLSTMSGKKPRRSGPAVLPPSEPAVGRVADSPKCQPSEAIGLARVTSSAPQSVPEAEPRMARRDRFSDGLVARAQSIFGARLKRDVSPAEARLMLGDLTDFFELAVVGMARLRRDDPNDPSSISDKLPPSSGHR